MENNNNVPVKFTQEIKDNWLANLKSGEYVQGFNALVKYDDDLDKPVYCCIGVLGNCTKGLSNELLNLSIKDADPYIFLKNTIGKLETQDLYLTNDNNNYQLTGKRDYSNVIPLIEALPVTE